MAQIFIQVDKPFYFAGETVNGHVYMNLFENMNAHQVAIKFKGWQSVRWIEMIDVPQSQHHQIHHGMIWGNEVYVSMDSSDSEYSGDQGVDQFMKYNYVRINGRLKRINRYSGGNSIAKFSTVLYNFGGNFIPAGQYSFPFSFKTGQKYPASFVDKSSDRSRKGRIKYQMQAYIRGANYRRRLLKYKTQIIIRQTTVIKNQKKQMQAHVKSCCCIDQGISKIQCFFQKNAYSPGQTANIFCILNTQQSKADVTEVTVSLMNTITYLSKQNHKKTIQSTIFHRKFPGLPKGEQAQFSKQVVILNDKNSDKTNIKPTARGIKLSSVYALKVQAVLSASCTCCSDLPLVYQPVLIYPYIPINYIFNAPQNWNPQSMPQKNINMVVEAKNENLQQMENPYY